jgi:peptidoglycan hydrolase-like protein with peptidoglycan-binding domain
MQQALKDKGYDPGPVDGVQGPRTTAALLAYQKAENITATGRADAETLGKLGIGVGGASTKGRQNP